MEADLESENEAARAVAVARITEQCEASHAPSIFALCCRLVPGWSVATDTLLSCEPVGGGFSGAKLWKVSRAAGDNDASGSGGGGSGVGDTMILRLNMPIAGRRRGQGRRRAQDEIAKCLAPGKIGGVDCAALDAVQGSSRFPQMWHDPLFESFTALEYLKGGDLRDGVGGTMAFEHAETAAELGAAIAEFHSAGRGDWHAKLTGGVNPLDTVAGKMPRALVMALRVARSDDLVSLFRASTMLNRPWIVKQLATIAALLPPGSLLGRSVVGHGDLHDGNLMRREAGGSKTDLVVCDFDRVAVMQAAADLGGYMGNRDGRYKKKWPMLEIRRAAATAYIENTPADVLAGCTRTTVDEVVIDMEAGMLMRTAFIALVLPGFLPGQMGVTISKWLCETRIKKAAEVLQRCATDSALAERVLREGVLVVADVA